VTVFPEGGPGHTEAVFYAGGPGYTKTALPYGTYEDLLLSPFDLAHGFPAYNIIQRRRGPRPANRLALQVWAGRDFLPLFPQPITLERASFGDIHRAAPLDP